MTKTLPSAIPPLDVIPTPKLLQNNNIILVILYLFAILHCIANAETPLALILGNQISETPLSAPAKDNLAPPKNNRVSGIFENFNDNLSDALPINKNDNKEIITPHQSACTRAH